MALDPLYARVADTDELPREAVAADTVAGLGGSVFINKVAFGTEGNGTMVSSADPLPVTTISEAYITTGRLPRRVEVGTVETIVSAADVTYRSRLVTNPSDFDVWIGHATGVGATGTNTGIIIKATGRNGGYSVGPEYRGNLYVISLDEAAYVVVQEV